MTPNILIARPRHIPNSAIEEIEEVMKPYGINVDSKIIGFKGAGEVPIYVQVLADLITWKNILGITVTAFLVKFAHKAGEDAYDTTKAILKYIASDISDKLKSLSKGVFKAIDKAEGDIYLSIGFPKPDSWNNTTFNFYAKNELEVQVNMAIFMLKAEAINKALDSFVLKNGKPSKGVFIEFNNDGSIVLTWYDSVSLKEKKHHIK